MPRFGGLQGCLVRVVVTGPDLAQLRKFPAWTEALMIVECGSRGFPWYKNSHLDFQMAQRIKEAWLQLDPNQTGSTQGQRSRICSADSLLAPQMGQSEEGESFLKERFLKQEDSQSINLFKFLSLNQQNRSAMAVFPFYKIASASEFLVITGIGIDDLKITKKGWIYPGQSYVIIDLSPVNYTFEVQAMSAEKLPFILPAVFTIGPKSDDMDCLKKFAKLIASHDKNSRHVMELVQGVIEGETRVLAASMTMEEVFKGTKEFKQEVFKTVQLELNQFGLFIYNANVKQLVDVPGHEYFSYLGQKTQMEAANQAKVDVAEADMKGMVGEKLRKGQTLQNAAKIDAETKIISTQREGEGAKEEIRIKTEVKVYENQREAVVAQANAELAKQKAGWDREAKVAEVQAAKAVALRDAELQKEVEMMNALTMTEKLKAEFLSKASVEAETKAQEANWNLYQKQKAADAILYQREKEAEAQKAAAEAQFFARQKVADGELYAKLKEAEGLVALGDAQGAYLRKLMESMGGNYASVRDFLMINGGMYQEIARINSEAVHGLQPKISIWTNGGEAADGGASAGNAAMKEVAGVYKMLPPLFTTVYEQTGMLPPNWMGALPADNAQLSSPEGN